VQRAVFDLISVKRGEGRGHRGGGLRERKREREGEGKGDKGITRMERRKVFSRGEGNEGIE
jgi:hypothetical protein